jgi:ketosteroid isomerase-like protein
MAVQTASWVRDLFTSIDSQDTPAFLGFLADNVSFRFGNAPVVDGKAAVGEVVSGFFKSIKEVRHEILEYWAHPGSVVCHGEVTYTRHDASILKVPFANVFKLEGALIREYLIFVDVSALYAPA